MFSVFTLKSSVSTVEVCFYSYRSISISYFTNTIMNIFCRAHLRGCFEQVKHVKKTLYRKLHGEAKHSQQNSFKDRKKAFAAEFV